MREVTVGKGLEVKRPRGLVKGGVKRFGATKTVVDVNQSPTFKVFYS